MKLILLGGISSHNKKWIENVEASTRDLFDDTEILYYEHWDSGRDVIDVDKEKRKLVDLVSDLEDYVIFAKSAGAVVTLKAIYESNIKPKACIFVGSAIKFAEGNGFQIGMWLKTNDVHKLFIQKEGDFAITFPDLKIILEKLDVENYEMVKLEGSDHEYADIGELKEHIRDFLGRVL